MQLQTKPATKSIRSTANGRRGQKRRAEIDEFGGFGSAGDLVAGKHWQAKPPAVLSE